MRSGLRMRRSGSGSRFHDQALAVPPDLEGAHTIAIASLLAGGRVGHAQRMNCELMHIYDHDQGQSAVRER